MKKSLIFTLLMAFAFGLGTQSGTVNKRQLLRI